MLDKVIEFKVDERVDSDYMLIKMEEDIEDTKEEGRKKVGEEENKNIMGREIISWDTEAKEDYKKKTEEWVEKENGNTNEVHIETKWRKLKKFIKKAIVYKTVKIRTKEIGYRDWWDKSYTKRKREVKRVYRKWKKGCITKEEEVYNAEEKTKRVYRGKKSSKENNIKGEEWKNHFMELLGGTEKDKEEARVEEMDKQKEDKELEDEEIERAMKKIKLKKAIRIDGVPMEAWRYGEKAVREGLKEILTIRMVWKEGNIPEDWRKSIIVPLYKKGDKEKSENYRGILLLYAVYKIYTEILRNRLKVEVEGKKLIPESHTIEKIKKCIQT